MGLGVVSGSQRVAFVDLKVACQARGSARSKTLSGLSAPSPVTDKSFIHHESQDREDRNSLLLRWNDSNKLQVQFFFYTAQYSKRGIVIIVVDDDISKQTVLRLSSQVQKMQIPRGWHKYVPLTKIVL